MLQEFVQQLVQKAGITEAQAVQAATVAQQFIKSKLPPQMAATVDGFFAGTYDPAAASAANATAAAGAKSEDWVDKAKNMAQDAGEKLSDFADKAKDKAEDFAQDAGKKLGEWADKAGDMAEDAMDKIKDMFSGKKDNDANAPKEPLK